jgi:putative ABC transport system permease protein
MSAPPPGSTSAGSPLPGWIARLLAWRLSGAWREVVLGDLAEEYAARVAIAPASALRWLLWQAIRCLAAPPPDRRSTALPSLPEEKHPMLQTLAADLRYAVRVLGRTPSFTLAVVAVLALGIGATTAIFSIVNAVLLRPLPYDGADRLVRLFHVPPQATFPGIARFSLSPANFYDWQRQATGFERMALYSGRSFTLTGSGAPRAMLAATVGAGFFDVLRIQPAQGRLFRPDEDAPGARVVVISDGFWRTEMGGAKVIGRSLTLDGNGYTIIGVLPASASLASWFPMARGLWVPLALTAEDRAIRDNHNLQVVARLKPGIGADEARSQLEVIAKRLEQTYPEANAGWGATLVSLQDDIVGDIGSTLVLLLAAVGLVLLIACANVGNLLFTRALGRRKEVAIRAALGAGRRRVLQQLLVESVVLGVAGGAAGLLLAEGGLRAGAALLAGQVPRADEIAIDGTVLLFVLAASIVTGILAGVVPALRVGGTPLTEALKEGGRGDGAIGLRTRRLLVVGEVALSVVLLMGAAVMVRSLIAIRTIDAGFEPDGVLTMIVNLPETRYRTDAQRSQFFAEALARMRALPGVAAAASIDDLPLTGGSVQPVVLEGRPELLPRDQPTVQVRTSSRDYAKVMQIPIVRGRDFADSDVESVLVSRNAARLLWGDADPVGKRVTLPLVSKTQLITVIGVVGDVKQDDLRQPPPPTIYTYSRVRPSRGLTLVLRTSVPPLSIVSAATAVIRGLDPEQPVQRVRTMADVRDNGLTSERFRALLLASFAIVALALASVGIYSVLSYIVRGRSREIGIRAALGAQTSDVLRLVVREGMTPALIGIAVGAVAAVAASVGLERLVYGVSASDPLTLAAVAGTLALVALLASVVPAWRASRIAPLSTLRG